MPAYDPGLLMRQARAEYFARSGFSADGGYGDKWVKLVKVGRFALGFPNTPSRVRAVKLHDLHHVLTEYKTTWTGEAEIGAWELASGCGRHYPAWVLNFGSFTIGLVLAPRRLFEAFVRGRHSRNLYTGEFEEQLLERTVGELRGELAIPAGVPAATVMDRLAFAVWCGMALLPGLFAIAAFLCASSVLPVSLW